MRVAFMGTPDFAVPVLDALLTAGHEIAAVYTQPPRPAGRGKQEQPSPVHHFAAEKGLEVRTPENLKAITDHASFAALDLDAAIVVAYGLILPQEILDAPRLGCLNVHASLLPRWRGAAPIQRALMAGDQETGITIMQMDAGLDTGPMLLRETTPIEPYDTASSLHDRLSQMGPPLLLQALAGLETGEITPTPQPEDGVTYAKKIDKAEARIDWTASAYEVDLHIRGLSPFPGAWFERGKTRVKVLRSHRVDGDGAPGEVLDDQLTVACGDGAVRLEELQRAGKGRQAAAEFLRGYPIRAGMVLP